MKNRREDLPEETACLIEKGAEKKRRSCPAEWGIMWLAVGLALICFLGGIYLQYGFRLSSPVFVEHSQATVWRSQEGSNSGETGKFWAEVSFSYITDSSDSRKVQAMTFPQLGGLRLLEVREITRETGGYLLHTMTGRLKQLDLDHSDSERLDSERTETEQREKEMAESEQSGWQLATEADVTYTDGTKETVSLGNLVLVEESKGEAKAAIMSSSSSSDGTSSRKIRFSSDGTVDVTVLGLEEEKENFEIRMDGTLLGEVEEKARKEEGIPVSGGSWMEITTTWLDVHPDLAPQTMTAPVILLEFQEDEPEGESGNKPVDGTDRGLENGAEWIPVTASYQKSYELRFRDVWKYLRGKGCI